MAVCGALTEAHLGIGATVIDESEGGAHIPMQRSSANVPPGVWSGGHPAVAEHVENAILVGMPCVSVLAVFYIVRHGLT